MPCRQTLIPASRVQTGFGLLADDFIEQYLDLNELLVDTNKRPILCV